jgi:hypothetical protein
MRKGVGHLQGTADRYPIISIKAVIKSGFIGLTPKVCGYLQVDPVLTDGDIRHFHRRAGLGRVIRTAPHHHNRFRRTGHFDPNKTVIELEGG